ncbi:glycoside hydrolase family 26 protein [Solwaraspora sp. WMMB335]|uniref:glycoside hydrolase family 26 protein n=1 Tax=Solwaraspora sp. WMMB335 TaxID=3404118 RepID=UPI003B943501
MRRVLAAVSAVAVILVGSFAAVVLQPVFAQESVSGSDQLANAGQADCTTDDEGYCLIGHNLGRVPTAVTVTLFAPLTGRDQLPFDLATDQFTDETFRLRALTTDGVEYVGELTVSYIAYASTTLPEPTPTPGGSTAPGPEPSSPESVPAPSVTPSPTDSAPPVGNVAATGGTRSGLPWMSGAYLNYTPQTYDAFGQWRGRPVDVAHVFTARKSWNDLVQPAFPINNMAGFPGKLVISQPPYPGGRGAVETGNNAACARGEYDERWKTFGRYLVANNRADSIIRIGWEFNGTFMYWHSDPDPTNWKECFRKVATAIRSTSPEVLIDWTFNAHATPVPTGNDPYRAYPGDEYVDIVGIDSYDWYPPSTSEAAWTAQCEDKNGLCHLLQFARQHGKKASVGEWGVASCSSSGKSHVIGGDNPLYVRKMWETFQEYQDVLLYETYFHEAHAGNVCSTIQGGGQNPKSSQEYLKYWGSAQV